MATVDECRQALHDLAARLDANAETRGKLDLDRSLACRVTDLGAAFHARLAGGRLLDIADGDDPKAKIALIAGSDDLVALHVAAHVAFFVALAAHLGMVLGKRLLPRMLPWGRPRSAPR